MENTFSMVAKTFKGLEPVLRDELLSLGAENVEIGTRMVSFEGDLELMYRANLCLRTALRVLKPIEKFTATDPDQLYDIVREIPWEKYMTPQTTFAIDATVNSADFTHSRFATYRVKDGIVDHFRDMNGERPSVRVSGYDLLFNVHIDGDRVTISLDSSGEPLNKRGYREEQTEAPINEVLAAGIIMTTGWRGDTDFADPMCGSGTFLIEAALIAANINPGIYRTSFAFEKWPDFDEELFEDLYNDDSAERPFNCKIRGGDIDPEAVAIARRNIKNAQVEDMVEIECKPMSEWTDNPEEGCLVMNPPYNHRLKQEDMTEMFRGIGTNLKRNFPGWNAWLIGPDTEDFDNIGLKPSIKIPLLNGSLECSLREYVLFDGRYDDFRADGGSVKDFDDDFRRDREPKKMRRISDDEWKSETRKFGDHKPQRKPGPDKKKQDRQDKRGGYDRNSFAKGGYDDNGYDNGYDNSFDRKSNGDFSRDRKQNGGYDRDRKPNGGFNRDRKPNGGYDRDRKPNGGYDRDRKPNGGYDRDRKSNGGYDRDRKPNGGYDRDRRSNGGYDRDRKPKKFVPSNQGPRISEDKSHTVNPVYFRSRKNKEQNEQNED